MNNEMGERRKQMRQFLGPETDIVNERYFMYRVAVYMGTLAWLPTFSLARGICVCLPFQSFCPTDREKFQAASQPWVVLDILLSKKLGSPRSPEIWLLLS